MLRNFNTNDQYCGFRKMAFIGWLRKSRHQRIIFVFIICIVTVVLFVLHGAILNHTSTSVQSSKKDHWWAGLKLKKDSLALPNIQHSDVDGSIAEVKGVFKQRDKMDALNRDPSVYRNGQLNVNLRNNDIYSAKKDSLLNSKDLMTYGAEQPQLRVVHLDFKGAPPKLGYLRTLFPLLAAAGANALLIEYEDMFPFEGTLKNISALNAYTKKQVQQIVTWATNLGMEVIPLVQTFGHLEYALKLEEFRHLRELAAFPQEVCPSNPDSFHTLVQELIRQVMALHPSTRFLHIGCDEVYHLAACGRCTKRRLDGRALFTEHVTRVATHVRSQHPGVIPLVWDDMFRQWAPMEIADSGLGALVEPVVWVYIDDITHLVPHYVWYMYGQSFPNVWVASAFKGAFGETQVAPDLNRHLRNHLAWLRLMNSKAKRESHSIAPTVSNFRGFVLTGWSRYDHFAILCELLPVSLPSLLLNLLLVSYKRTKSIGAEIRTNEDEKKELDPVFQQWLQTLNCPSSYSRVSLTTLTTDPYQWRLGTCAFPGSNLYAVIGAYMSLKSRVETLYHEITETSGWMSPYNVRHKFSSPYRVLHAFSSSEIGGPRLAMEVREFRNTTARVLTQYFDNFTVQEWLEQKIDPLYEKIFNLEKSVQKLISVDTWPRRPLT